MWRNDEINSESKPNLEIFNQSIAYNLSELNKIYEVLLSSTPSATQAYALNLVKSTITFLNETNSDPLFIEMRKKYKTDKDLLRMLNTMSRALDEHNPNDSAKKTDDDLKFISAARTYCQQTLVSQINEMKVSDPRFFDLYQSDKLADSLKNTIEDTSTLTHSIKS